MYTNHTEVFQARFLVSLCILFFEMASANCESPLRRFAAKENTPKANSPVEVNRLKTLLRKKVGDVSVQGSPKKATPRKEVKVKRDKTMKLCSSCVHHNKDVCSSPVITEGQGTNIGSTCSFSLFIK